jgi:ABC-type Mn2+/Zn2+ transport system permease subunit
MSINWHSIQLWLVLAALAGIVFGLLGFFAVRRDWKGARATAVLLGLLLADAYRRFSNWGVDVAVIVDVLAAHAVFIIASRYNRKPLLTLSLTVGTGIPRTSARLCP